MHRRTHKKSRQGCSECKRRHIKCDETRPKCVNCSTARIHCPFESIRSGQQSSPAGGNDVDGSPMVDVQSSSAIVTGSAGLSAGSTGTFDDVSISSPSSAPSSSQAVQHTDDSTINMLHLELFNQWQNFTYSSIGPKNDSPGLYRCITIKYGLRNPFLMQEILAVSALHLAIRQPHRRDRLLQQASTLQTQALSGFNTVIQHIDSNSILPAFLFSSLIGFHSFCEAFSFHAYQHEAERKQNFHGFLDRVTHCITLMRGIRSVIGPWWETLQNSELAPMLTNAQSTHQTLHAPSKELDELRRLVETADLSPTSIAACREAVKELQWVLNVQINTPPSPDTTKNTNECADMIFAWPVTVPLGYNELLSQRRPEALVILAHYAALLYYRRHFWAMGDAGRYLIEGIASHLGKHWEKWLVWPNSVLTDPSFAPTRTGS